MLKIRYFTKVIKQPLSVSLIILTLGLNHEYLSIFDAPPLRNIRLFSSGFGQSTSPVDEHEHEHEHSSVEEENLLAPDHSRLRGDFSDLFALDQRILELSRQYQRTLTQLEALETKQIQYHNEITALDSSIQRDQVSLLKLLTLKERIKPTRIVELLTSVDGPLEQKRREVYLSALFKLGARRLNALQQARRDIHTRRSALEQLADKQRHLRGILEGQREELSAERAREWEAISQIGGSRTSTKRPRSNKDFENMGLRFPPARGQWIDEFRSFRGLSLAKLYGGGIWILNSSGAPVYSAEAGEVIFAGSVKGWGQIVIMDHAGGYLTIYGNLTDLRVREGQGISAQTLLGVMTHEAGREGLYFELRRGGEPIHPERWIDPQLVRIP